MLTVAQHDVLNGFIGNAGIYFETIRDYDGVTWGTKTLYLERAISQDCQNFLQSLDKLYQPAITGDGKASHLNFIRALKAMNDLCFNNPVKFGDYGTRGALKHYFGGLGTVTPAIAMDFKTVIQSMVNSKLVALRAEHPEVNLQRQARIAAEADAATITGWRNELDLPAAQLSSPAQAIHSAGNPNIFFNNLAPTHQQAQHPIPVAIQQAIALAELNEDQLRYITKPACIQAIQEGVFTVQELSRANDGQLMHITDPDCIQAIKNRIYNIQQLTEKSPCILSYLMIPRVIEAITEGLFTADILQQDRRNRTLDLISSSACIQAIRDGRITIDELAEMEHDVIFDAVYPDNSSNNCMVLR